MRVHALVLFAALASGCASSGQTASDSASTGATVDFIVINRTSGPVTAFALWRDGPRSPLGEVAARSTRRFTTPHRGAEVWLSVNVLSAPSQGTVAQPPTFSAGGGDTRTREAPRTYARIEAGDAFEWEITSTYPTVEVQHRPLLSPN
ncbi:MAG: hypothetical protein FJ207_00360 [Gemmatimonadetes bacterium]|nr:hypothetical protein [Gemmatimonadota bacterium]